MSKFFFKKLLNEKIPDNSKDVNSTDDENNSTHIPKRRTTLSSQKKVNSVSLTDCIYFNARSIVNKTKELDALLKLEEYSFIFIVETWLKPAYTDSFVINSNNYGVIRCDRLIERGGGACVIFKRTLASKVSIIDIDDSYSGFEIVAFDFFTSDSTSCRFVCVYLPPLSASDKDVVKSLVKILRKLTTKSNFYLVGDFNFSKIDWKSVSLTSGKQTFQEFKDYLDDHALTQTITFSTHTHDKTLDLLITSTPQSVLKLDKREPLTDTCDHNMIKFSLNLGQIKTKKQHQKRNFYRGNYEKLNQFFSNYNWDSLFCGRNDVNEVYKKFISIVHKAIEMYVPMSKTRKKTHFPENIKKLLNMKKLLYRRIKFDKTSKQRYKEVCKLYKQEVTRYFHIQEKQVLYSANKKSFYGYVNQKLKSKSTLPPLLDRNDNLVVDATTKANILNSHFSDVFQKDDHHIPSIYHNTLHNTHTMDDFVISAEHTLQAITKLKNTVSNTPDQVPALFIKNTKKSLSGPLTKLFNLSLQQGIVPHLWKKAIVTPIFKKGVRSKASNYRPISLTSVFCRIFESIIHDQLTDHLMENQLITKAQHGFIKSRSTQTQQLEFFNEITANYENSVPSTIVYLDFSKAFDSVSHSKLLNILHHLKINCQTINWIKEYLSERSQQTTVEGSLSLPCEVSSGVPQGSVLGPLLFVLYLDDLIRRLVDLNSVSVYAFADDLKLLSSNSNALKQALIIVEKWSSDWQLRIQPTKSEQITFTRHPLPSNISLQINQSLIPHVDKVKDLGVIVSVDLKWHHYVSKVCTKSQGLIYLILKSFSSYDHTFYINLYKLYIRPNLEYNVCTWMPSLIGDIRKLESVQGKFTRLLCKKLNIRYNNYFHRLETLNLETLEIRRVKQDLILIYKILNNLIDLDFDKFFTFNPALNLYSLRRHKFYIQHSHMPETSVRNNFFSYRIINTWNNLPEVVVSQKSLSLFKNKLNEFNLYSIYKSKLESPFLYSG